MTRNQLIEIIRDADKDNTAKELKAICQMIRGTDLDIYPVDGNSKAAYFETIWMLQDDIAYGRIA